MTWLAGPSTALCTESGLISQPSLSPQDTGTGSDSSVSILVSEDKDATISLVQEKDETCCCINCDDDICDIVSVEQFK